MPCRFIACRYCSYSSRMGVSFLISFPVSSCLARLVLLIAFPPGGGVPFYPVLPAHRLIVSSLSSCRGVLLARLVFLFIRLIVLMVCDEMFLRGRRPCRIIPMGVRLAPPLRLARFLLIRLEAVMRSSVPVLRHPVMRRQGRQGRQRMGTRRNELDKTARPQDGRQACGTSGKTGRATRRRDETV